MNVDPELVRAAQGGDALAVDRLLDELAPYVRRLRRAVCPAAADDATQEALIAIFRGLRTLENPAAIIVWARAVGVRAAMRVAQRARPESALDEATQPRARDAAERLVDIADVLRQLPPEQRAVLALRAVEGLSEREVADTLGLALGTVKSRLHRARASFREAWDR
jgi:RNA polymerase sigma-70 factor (ECF subfamily)